jgi:peroxiredoxin
VLSKRVKSFYRDFPTRYPPGAEFPQIVLETTDGQTIDTRAFRGQQHFVLFTGAIT